MSPAPRADGNVREIPDSRLPTPDSGLFLHPSSLILHPSAVVDGPSVFEGITKRYGKVATLTADFVQLYRGSRTIREVGVLQLKKPGKMRWDYREPGVKRFLSDGKKTFFYSQSRNSYYVEPIRASRDPRTPFLFLLGRSDQGKLFSRIELAGEPPLNPGHVVVKLVPARAVENLAAIFVECNPGDFKLSRVGLLMANGDRSDFLLSNVVENAVIPDSAFAITPPPGAKVERVQ